MQVNCDVRVRVRVYPVATFHISLLQQVYSRELESDPVHYPHNSGYEKRGQKKDCCRLDVPGLSQEPLPYRRHSHHHNGHNDDGNQEWVSGTSISPHLIGLAPRPGSRIPRLDQPSDPVDAMRVVRQTRHDRRSCLQRAVNATEVVVRETERQGVLVALDALAESVRATTEPPERHTDRQIMPLGV